METETGDKYPCGMGEDFIDNAKVYGFGPALRHDWERTKETLRNSNLGFYSGLLGAYLAATVALNVAVTPFVLGMNGLERAIGAEKRERIATLLDKGIYEGHSVKICWGKFKTDNNEVVTLTDGPDIPTGKLFSNTELCWAKKGDSYKVESLEGPISNKVLNIKKIK